MADQNSNPVENIPLDFHVDNPHGNPHGYPRNEHAFPRGYPCEFPHGYPRGNPDGFYVINPRENRDNTFRFANFAKTVKRFIIGSRNELTTLSQRRNVRLCRKKFVSGTC